MSLLSDNAERMSDFGLGTSVLASLGRAVPKKDAEKLIQGALDHGITTIDTSDTYGAGDSERTICYGLGARRDECFLMTKAGFPFAAFPGFLSPLNQVAKKVMQRVSPAQNFSKQYLLSALEGSLRRLNTDHVDAFFLHEPDLQKLTPESWEFLDQIRSQGKSRLTGVSTTSLAVLNQGLQSGQVGIVQTSVSIEVGSRHAILDTCASHGIPVVANEVLRPKNGLLQDPAWEAMLTAHGFTLRDSIAALLVFAKNEAAVRTVLCGTRSISHLLENLEGVKQAESMRSLVTAMKGLRE